MPPRQVSVPNGVTPTTSSPGTRSGARLVARIEDAAQRASTWSTRDGSSVEHVLAVVQHHQRRRGTQRRLDAGEERRRLLDTQRPGGDRRHAVTAGGERQVNEPHTRSGLRRGGDSEPGLADTSRSNERHDVTSTEPIDDGGDLGGPPDERGSPLRECTGEITRTGESAARRREGRMDEPPHPLGLRRSPRSRTMPSSLTDARWGSCGAT